MSVGFRRLGKSESGCCPRPGDGRESRPQVLEVSKVGRYSRPSNDGGHTDAKSAQGGEQPTLVGQRVRARRGGSQSGERPKASFYPKDAAAVAGSLQPLYRFLDLLLYRRRVGLMVWFRHGQQELPHSSGEFLPLFSVCVAEFKHSGQ